MSDALVAALEYPHPHLPYGLPAKPSKELWSLSGRDVVAQDAALPPSASQERLGAGRALGTGFTTLNLKLIWKQAGVTNILPSYTNLRLPI